ncbi:MAG: hypothetical protein ACPGO5_00735 [Patescibacteria group bacterium]
MVEALQPFLIFVYLLGMAALLGGLIAQWGERTYHVERALLYGVFLQLIASVVYVFTSSVATELLSHMLRVIVLCAIIVILLVAKQRKFSWNAYHSVLVLVIAELAIGVFWF